MSVRPAPIYASSTLKSPPPGSINPNDNENNNKNDNNHIDNDDDMMKIDDDETGTSSIPLVLAPEYILKLGCRVVMDGLVHTTKLNGHLGIVEDYLSDEGRYVIRPLGRTAKRMTKSKFVSIRPNHLTEVDDTAFIANLTIDRKTGKQQKLPLQLKIFWSDEPNPQDQQLIIQLVYSNVWKNKKQFQKQFNNGCYIGGTTSSSSTSTTGEEISESNNNDCSPASGTTNNSKDDDDVFLDSVNTRIDYDEHVSEDQWLDGYEILILTHKPLYEELYDAMLDYEIIEEMEDLQVHVGLNGDVPLCRLKHNFPIDEPNNYGDMTGGGSGVGDDGAKATGIGQKQEKEEVDGLDNNNVDDAVPLDYEAEVVDELSANKKRKGRD